MGKVFDPANVDDVPFMKEFAQSPSAIVFDDFVRVFFSCRPAIDESGQYLSYLGFVDLDRSDLMKIRGVSQKPIIPLGELGTFDEFGTNPASVIATNDGLVMYYTGWTRCVSVPVSTSIGIAISHDNGVEFKRLGPGPVLSFSPDEPFTLGSPRIKKFNGKYYLWYVAGKKWVQHHVKAEPVYKIRMATSEDGINWTKTGRDLIENILEEDECQASAEVFFRGGKYHMYFSYRYNTDFKSKGRGYRIGYAHSEDLLHWTRADELAGIDMSESGWDSDSISYPNIFELDGQIYMLYQGNEMGRCGFGLALLEK